MIPTLRESVQIATDYKSWEAVAGNEDIYNKIEFFDVKNPFNSDMIVVHLYDENYEDLGAVKFSTPDIAAAFLDEFFEIDEDDLQEIYAVHDSTPQ